jgi:rare lipoprotein A
MWYAEPPETMTGGYMRFVAALLILILMASTAHAKTCGRASYYHTGQRTANGEHFHPDGLTAAHRTLGFGTILDVVMGHRKTRVRINDRGPFIPGRSLDLSRGAARQLGMLSQGVGKVCYEIRHKGKIRGRHRHHHRHRR